VNDEDAPPPLRVERIIAALEENRVKYVLVGGIAGRFHRAQRATSDLDIVMRSGADADVALSGVSGASERVASGAGTASAALATSSRRSLAAEGRV
jgi:hypothetical protein